jgi:hypothetical protein
MFDAIATAVAAARAGLASRAGEAPPMARAADE